MVNKLTQLEIHQGLVPQKPLKAKIIIKSIINFRGGAPSLLQIGRRLRISEEAPDPGGTGGKNQKLHVLFMFLFYF